MTTRIGASRLRQALDLASTQRGAVSARQLRTILHPREITAAMDQRILVRLWRGMYAVSSDQPVAAATRIAAAALTLNRPIVPCLCTAAEVHGFLPAPCSRTHVRAGGTSTSVQSELVIHRHRPIAPTVTVGGQTVEDPGETAVRLTARQDGPWTILAVLDAALHSGAVNSVDRLRELAALLPGRGVRYVRQLAPLADEAARTGIDSWVRWMCLDRSVDVPEIDSPGCRVGGGVRSDDRFDFRWPRYGVAATLVPVDDPRLLGSHVLRSPLDGCDGTHLLLESLSADVHAPDTGPIHPAAVARLMTALVAGRRDRVWARAGHVGTGSVTGAAGWLARRPLLRTGGTPAGTLAPRVDLRPPRR